MRRRGDWESMLFEYLLVVIAVLIVLCIGKGLS